MKNTLKYILLIIFAFTASIIIYEYVEANTEVNIEEDILVTQQTLENEFLSSTDYSINNPKVILNPYGNSPLTALVIFETSDLTTPTIIVKGKDKEDDLAHTFLPNKVHILPIYGLYPNYNNEVEIKVSGITKKINIKTDKLPKDFIKLNKITGDLETEEFYFTTPEDKSYTAAYDKYGNVRWYLIGDYKWDINRLNNGHLLISSAKLVNLPYYSKGLIEIDLLGKVYFQYDIPNGYHHDAVELENGNFLLASNNLKDGTTEDYIIEVNRNTGNIVKNWNLHKLQVNEKENWLGLNSLFYNKQNNSITFAGSNNNMLGNVDYKSNEVNWLIAKKENVPTKFQKYILDYDFTLNNPSSINKGDNNEIIFINTKEDGLYLTTIKIDTENKKADLIRETLIDENKTDANLDVLGENNYLITGDNYVKEINENEELTIETNSDLYNSKKLSLYANDVYTSGAGTKLGSLGITPTTKNVSVFFHKNDKNIMKKYNLKLVKEADRLVVTGTFKASDEVSVILDNFLTKKTYDLPISNTPYENKQKNNKKITVSKYINDEDVYGKYYIFIRINGVNYKLGKYVIF